MTSNNGGKEDSEATLDGYRAGYYGVLAMLVLGLVCSIFFTLPSKDDTEQEKQDLRPLPNSSQQNTEVPLSLCLVTVKMELSRRREYDGGKREKDLLLLCSCLVLGRGLLFELEIETRNVGGSKYRIRGIFNDAYNIALVS